MSLLSAHNLSKSFGGNVVLHDVSITVEEGDRLAIIGRNGAGKSTLVRVLMGRDDADGGEIMRRRDLEIGLVEQVPRLDPEASVEQVVRLGLNRHHRIHARLEELEHEMAHARDAALASLVDMQAHLAAELERLGGWNLEHLADAMMDALEVPPKQRRIGDLSIGEQRRVALCVGLLQKPALLVLDEPTNHLDVAAIDWLETALTNYPGTLILITHDRYFLDGVATRLAELDGGRLRVFEGNYSDYLLRKAELDAIDARTEHNRSRAILHELEWVQRSPAARTTKQKARIRRFEELVAETPREKVDDVAFQLPHPPRIGKTILEIRNLHKSYGAKTLCAGLNLLLKRGDRIGIIGPNGIGKTTLIRMILGEIQPDAGSVVLGQNTEIVYADQARATLDDRNTVLEEVAGDNDKVWVGERPVQVQTFLSQLLFDGAAQRALVGSLSGGERSRVALAKALRKAGNLLILDEPTNDLDLPTLRVLEDALEVFPGCALVISHDRYFLDRITTAILAFEGDGRVVLYEGSHGLHRDRLNAMAAASATERRDAASAEKKAPRLPRSSPPPAPKTKRSFREEQEFRAMEAGILEAESELANLETELSDPGVVQRLGAGLPAKMAALEAARAKVDGLYARWAELGEWDAYN